MGTSILATIQISGILAALGGAGVVVLFFFIQAFRRATKKQDDTTTGQVTGVTDQDEPGTTVAPGQEVAPIRAPQEKAHDISPGEEQILKLTALYQKDLTEEAERVADRSNADRASVAHVKRADQNIRTPHSKRGELGDLLIAFGSILVGGAISHLPGLPLTTGSWESNGPFVVAAFVVGAVFLTIATMLKFRR